MSECKTRAGEGELGFGSTELYLTKVIIRKIPLQAGVSIALGVFYRCCWFLVLLGFFKFPSSTAPLFTLLPLLPGLIPIQH